MAKLQAAIDRVSREKAQEMISQLDSHVSIIEVGTSLVKEYGMRNLASLVEAAERTPLLADMKICDEGAYEAQLACEMGFAYVTAMGTASPATLEACYEVTQSHGVTLMIDLLECDESRIGKINHFPDAVYCLHTSVDAGGTANPARDIRAFRENWPQIQHIAIAGGIKRDQLNAIREAGADIVVMGSALTKAADIQDACAQCMREMA